MEFAMRVSHSLYEAGFVDVLRSMADPAVQETVPSQDKQSAKFAADVSGMLRGNRSPEC